MTAPADSRLQQSETEYRAIFEASSDGLVINDAETGVVLEANPAFCQMHGYARMTGLHPTAFIHPESFPLFGEYVRAIQDGREFRGRARDVRRDGTVFDVEVLGRGLMYQGRFAMLGVVRDVTEQVRAYEILEQRVAERTREVDRRRQVAEALRDLMAVVNSQRTLDEILNHVAAQAGQLLGSQATAIYVPVREDGEEVLRVAASSLLTEEYAAVRVPFGMPVTGLAFEKRRAVGVYDIPAALAADAPASEEPRFEDRTSHLRSLRLWAGWEDKGPRGNERVLRLGAFAEGFRAVLAVPLAVKDETYGALTLYYREAHEFAHEEVWLATAFADQAALAIENARLHAQSEQRLREQEALYRADEEMHRSLRLDEVLRALAQVAAEILSADTTSVLVWDSTGTQLVLGASHGLSRAERARMVFAPGEGITGKVAVTGQLRVVEDATLETDSVPRHDRPNTVRAGMFVPIMVADQVFGVFTVGYRIRRAFSSSDQRLLLSLAQRAALAIENARLHEDAQRRLKGIEALYQADEQIYRSLRLDEVLEALVDVASDLLRPDKVSVGILDEGTGRIVVGAARGFSQTTVAESVQADEMHLLTEYLSGGVVTMEDSQNDARLPPSIIATNRREGIRSSLTAPIRIGSEVIGAFGLSYSRSRTFTDEEQRLLAALAQRAAMSIHNARLHEESEQRRQELEGLYQADAALHRSLRLHDVLEALVDAAIDLLHADCVGLWGAGPQDAHRSIPLATRGLSVQYLEETLRLNETPGIAEWWFARESFAMADAVHDLSFPPAHRAALEREGYRALLSTQVRVGDQVFGSFTVGFRATHTFGPIEKRVLATLAQRAGLAIQNARLHEESEQRRQELEALYDADAALHRSLRLDEVLQTLVDLAGAILSAEKTGVWILVEGDRVTMRAAHGVSPEFQQESFTLEEATVGGGAVWSDVQVVEDVLTDAAVHPRMRAAVAREGVRAWVSATIRTPDEVFGSFSAAYVEPRSFSDQERRLVVALAQRAALAIQNARLYEQVQLAATLEERQRLARELHDAVTQTLFSTALIAEVIPELWDIDPGEGRQRLEELRRLTRGALAEMRTLLVELRPGALTELPLEDLLRQLGEATAGRTRLEVNVQTDRHLDEQIPAEVRVALYRIAQEALNNTVKHAQARRASVRLAQAMDGELSLLIEDNGKGFDPATVPAGHLGVDIMRERAQTIGAVLRVVSRPGQGTRIEVSCRPREEAAK